MAQVSNDILRVLLEKRSAGGRQNGQTYLHHFVDCWVYSCRLLDVVIAPGLPVRLFSDVRILPQHSCSRRMSGEGGLWRKNTVTQYIRDGRIVELILEVKPLVFGQLVSV